MNQHIPVEHGNPPIINPNMLTENPHANFAALRVHYPLICLGDKHYMALRAKDVLSLLTDPRTKQIEGRDYVRLNRMPESASSRFLSDFLLFSNDDEHRTKRGLFARTFAHGAMRTMRSEIRAVADRIVITKYDVAEPEALAALEARLRALNPGAPIHRAVMGEIDPALLFDTGLYDPKTKSVDVQRWLRDEAYAAADSHHDHDHDHDHGHDHAHGHHHSHDVNRHDASIAAFCITRDDPIDWEALVAWIRILIGRHGDRLLRIKGILNIAGRDRPIAIHGVQHMFHDPAELAEWPDADRRSKIVFITRDLDRSVIEEKLDSLQAQAASLDG